jgi:hypothetical protein
VVVVVVVVVVSYEGDIVKLELMATQSPAQHIVKET